MSTQMANASQISYNVTNTVTRVGRDFTKRDHRQFDDRQRRSAADRRSEARHDRDRIYYSAGLLRLSRVTQVITPAPDGASVHNRLTHSLRVAQIARSLAENFLDDPGNHDLLCNLGGLDADVAAAAALAHDIGHPPFGHAGEQVLDEMARNQLDLPDGFEGNAQTFRIATKLEQRTTSYAGLGLTRATLAGLLKYPWVRPRTRDTGTPGNHLEARKWDKFNAYDSENSELNDAREFLPPDYPKETQSLEASIMDVADDIAYAVHDLEDFMMACVIDLRVVREDLKILMDGGTGLRFTGAVEDWKTKYPQYFQPGLLKEAAKILYGTLAILDRRFDGSSDDISAVREICSHLIDKYIGSVVLPNRQNIATHWPGGPYIALSQATWHEVQILKHITRAEVVERTDVALLQRGQQDLLRSLVERLFEWIGSKDFGRLPNRLKEEVNLIRSINDKSISIGHNRPNYPLLGMEARAVLDYLCTLTDGQCRHLNQLLSGGMVPSITGAFSI